MRMRTSFTHEPNASGRFDDTNARQGVSHHNDRTRQRFPCRTNPPPVVLNDSGSVCATHHIMIVGLKRARTCSMVQNTAGRPRETRVCTRVTEVHSQAVRHNDALCSRCGALDSRAGVRQVPSVANATPPMYVDTKPTRNARCSFCSRAVWNARCSFCSRAVWNARCSFFPNPRTHMLTRARAPRERRESAAAAAESTRACAERAPRERGRREHARVRRESAERAPRERGRRRREHARVRRESAVAAAESPKSHVDILIHRVRHGHGDVCLDAVAHEHLDHVRTLLIHVVGLGACERKRDGVAVNSRRLRCVQDA